jgi:hypothetical protein
VVHRLAHRGPPEHQRFHAEEPAILGDLDLQDAIERTTVEQDALLWQVFGRAARAHVNRGAHACRRIAGERPIEPSGRLWGERRPRPGANGQLGSQKVAAGDTTGRVQCHHLGPIGRARKPRLQAAFLAQIIQHRHHSSPTHRHA